MRFENFEMVGTPNQNFDKVKIFRNLTIETEFRNFSQGASHRTVVSSSLREIGWK